MADAREPNAALASEPKVMRWAEFLATAPPDSSSEITDLWLMKEQSPRLNTPEVFLYCDSEACDGPRFFEYVSGETSVRRFENGALNYKTWSVELQEKK